MVFNFQQYRYSPCFKTKDGEIKAYIQVNSNLKNEILPLVELTRGRRSKNDSLGSISKRLDKFNDLFGNNYFILDITSQEAQLNDELESFLDPNNGFKNWCDFLIKTIKPTYNVIPIAHISDDETLWSDIYQEIKFLLNQFGHIAIRLFAKDRNNTLIIKKICKNFASSSITNIIIIYDYEYLEYGRTLGYLNNTISTISQIEKKGFNKFIFTSSAYPKNIAQTCNNPDYGSLKKEEKLLYSQIINHLSKSSDTVYGDYASIHPIVLDAIPRAPIPKIEFTSKSEYIYYRGNYSNTNIAYYSLAQKVVADSNFNLVKKCWGKNMISDAAHNKIFARNATNWIAVRMNIHITTMV